MGERRILYVQYTNPGAYPPLGHSARILAREGWAVRFVGTGDENPLEMQFPESPGITIERMPWRRPGPGQKLHYLRYCLWVARVARAWRPAWLYVSDPLGAAAGLLAQRVAGCRVVYHEHDAPSHPGALQPLVRRARARLARRADLCVAPNRERADVLQAQTGVTREVLPVWNCPPRDEIDRPAGPADAGGPPEPGPNGAFRLLYQGSITPARLPLAVVDALAHIGPPAELWVVGYETGPRGYLERLRARAAEVKVADRLRILGMRSRSDVLALTRRCQVGLSLVPLDPQDVNLRHLVGASNKTFEYLAHGLTVLVADRPEWCRAFVEPGYAVACDPGDPASLVRALGWIRDHPDETRRMAGAARARLRAEWHYECQFEPVRERLAGALAA